MCHVTVDLMRYVALLGITKLFDAAYSAVRILFLVFAIMGF